MPIGGKRYFKSIVKECFDLCTRELTGRSRKLRGIRYWVDQNGKMDRRTLEEISDVIFGDDTENREVWLDYVDVMHVEFYESVSSRVHIASRKGKGPHWLSIS